MNPNSAPHSNRAPTASQPPKLLDRLRLLLEQERFETVTISRIVEWNRRLIVFHRLRHPQSLTDQEIEAFVQQAATGWPDPASTSTPRGGKGDIPNIY